MLPQNGRVPLINVRENRTPRKKSAPPPDKRQKNGTFLSLALRSALPHTGSPGPFRPRTPEESEKSPERVPRGRAPKVPKECAPESQKSPKRVRKSGFRLFSDSFETPGRTLSALLGPCPGVLFPDSFRTLRGFWARRARETLWGAGPIASLAFYDVPSLPSEMPFQTCLSHRPLNVHF